MLMMWLLWVVYIEREFGEAYDIYDDVTLILELGLMWACPRPDSFYIVSEPCVDVVLSPTTAGEGSECGRRK